MTEREWNDTVYNCSYIDILKFHILIKLTYVIKLIYCRLCLFLQLVFTENKLCLLIAIYALKFILNCAFLNKMKNIFICVDLKFLFFYH